jgi:hypothetical protein
MALREPVAVFNAANNVEAFLVRTTLVNSGIEAFVTEDISQAGTWMFGLLPEIHKPQVWIERKDWERAKPILDDYERRAGELRAAGAPGASQTEAAIEVICEECGERSAYLEAQRGSVQECRHCGAYIDVSNEAGSQDWGECQENEDTGEETK